MTTTKRTTKRTTKWTTRRWMAGLVGLAMTVALGCGAEPPEETALEEDAAAEGKADAVCLTPAALLTMQQQPLQLPDVHALGAAFEGMVKALQKARGARRPGASVRKLCLPREAARVLGATMDLVRAMPQHTVLLTRAARRLPRAGIPALTRLMTMAEATQVADDVVRAAEAAGLVAQPLTAATGPKNQREWLCIAWKVIAVVSAVATIYEVGEWLLSDPPKEAPPRPPREQLRRCADLLGAAEAARQCERLGKRPGEEAFCVDLERCQPEWCVC